MNTGGVTRCINIKQMHLSNQINQINICSFHLVTILSTSDDGKNYENSAWMKPEHCQVPETHWDKLNESTRFRNCLVADLQGKQTSHIIGRMIIDINDKNSQNTSRKYLLYPGGLYTVYLYHIAAHSTGEDTVCLTSLTEFQNVIINQ